MARRLMHMYYGFGRGKTTSVFGLAVRAAGRGWKVMIVQFLKNRTTGEVEYLSGMKNITILRGMANNSNMLIMNVSELERTRIIHNQNMTRAFEAARNGEIDLLILDEALDAYQSALMDTEAFEEFVKNKPDDLELVITGHIEEEFIEEIADYVTCFTKEKHPYDKGIDAREGIEY
ncbi:MAG: cob(I)yrinic acid a,c-diamide adenosyltransferase [Eubacteriales bacterium]|nr:cob(I)yrinic acid a,c-diamide adenosyltransferase [Eubacteriales bacterium]